MDVIGLFGTHPVQLFFSDRWRILLIDRLHCLFQLLPSLGKEVVWDLRSDWERFDDKLLGSRIVVASHHTTSKHGKISGSSISWQNNTYLLLPFKVFIFYFLSNRSNGQQVSSLVMPQLQPWRKEKRSDWTKRQMQPMASTTGLSVHQQLVCFSILFSQRTVRKNVQILNFIDL